MEDKSINVGKVAMTMGGNYDPSKAYDKLVCVNYNYRSWVSKKPVSEGIVPSEANSAFWQMISDRGERGPQGQSYVDKELVPIVDDLTTGGSANVLSAEQGKVLKQELTELESKVAPNNASLISINKCIVFDNAAKKIINKDNADYLSFNNNKAIVRPFTEVDYGIISGANGNLAIVDTNEGIKVKQTLIDVKTTDRIVALARVRFISEVDASGMYTYEIERIIYCSVPYVLLNNDKIEDYTAKAEKTAIASLLNRRKIDFSKEREYNRIFTPNLTYYNGKHYRIPVLPGFVVDITTKDNYGSSVVFLKTDESMDYIEGAKRIDIPKGTRNEITIPDGCHCLYIVKIDGAGDDVTPSNVIIKNCAASTWFQNNFYTLGKLTFNNIDKTINIVGDSGVTSLDKYHNIRVTSIIDVPYGKVNGDNGYIAVAINEKNEIIVNNYNQLSRNDSIIAVVRVIFGSFDGGKYNYLVDYVYYSKVECDVINVSDWKSLNVIPYSGNKLVLQPTLKCRTFGNNILQSWVDNCAAQGMAIYNGYMFQLYHTGFVRIYDITKAEPVFINQFNLGSYNEHNHANSAQFGRFKTDNGFPYLYVGHTTEESRKMSVEKIDLNGSQLVQTISFDVIDALPDSLAFNAVVGDDGYIWVNGYKETKLYFAKFRLPSIEDGDITIGLDYLVDSWVENDYIWEEEVNQDISVYNGKFFFQYGGSYNRRGIKVYDTSTHLLLNNLDLTDYVSDEFEGMDIFNGKIYITLLANKGYILEL